MNTQQAVRQFSFIMDPREFRQVASKQQIIAAIPRGAELTLMHIRSQHDRFGYFEVFYGNKKIGAVPPQYTEQFFENGVLQNNKCFVDGLVPQGSFTVTCKIRVEIYPTETPVIPVEDDSKLSFFPEILPPKRNREKRAVKCAPPVYISGEMPVKRAFYKNELVILILCILFPPAGIVLLILYSKRSTPQKTALISVGVCICFSVFFACYTAAVNAPKPEIVTSNNPDRVAMQFVQSWQSEQWSNLLYLSAPGISEDVLDEVQEVFGAIKIADFQFTEVYRSDNRVTYLLNITVAPEDDDDKKKKKPAKKSDSEEETEIELETREFTFDVERIGTVWYADIKSLNHELFDEPLETLFACDSHVVIEEKPPVMVYIDQNTMTYHNRKGCAPDGAPKNTISDALRKGYGPCGRCAR